MQVCEHHICSTDCKNLTGIVSLACVVVVVQGVSIRIKGVDDFDEGTVNASTTALEASHCLKASHGAKNYIALSSLHIFVGHVRELINEMLFPISFFTPGTRQIFV